MASAVRRGGYIVDPPRREEFDCNFSKVVKVALPIIVSLAAFFLFSVEVAAVIVFAAIALTLVANFGQDCCPAGYLYGDRYVDSGHPVRRQGAFVGSAVRSEQRSRVTSGAPPFPPTLPIPPADLSRLFSREPVGAGHLPLRQGAFIGDPHPTLLDPLPPHLIPLPEPDRRGRAPVIQVYPPPAPPPVGVVRPREPVGEPNVPRAPVEVYPPPQPQALVPPPAQAAHPRERVGGGRAPVGGAPARLPYAQVAAPAAPPPARQPEREPVGDGRSAGGTAREGVGTGRRRP